MSIRAEEIPQQCLAVQLQAYGQAVVVEHVPSPVAGPGQLLIRVEAGGVNPVDWKIRDGQRRERMPLELPVVIGCDIAGSVVDVGEGVGGFAVGQRVFAMVGLYGGFQELLAVPADRVACVPEGVSTETAASIPLAALTAWQALQLATPVAGERILIHAAAGGVGSFAVQLAKSLGLQVVATASTHSMDHVQQLGANQVIDYRRQAFDAESGPVDIVLDLVGGDTQRRSWPLLRAGGRLVSTIAVPEVGADGRHPGVFAVRVGVRPNGEPLRHLAALAAEGRLRSRVQRCFPLAQAQDALEFNKAGGAIGKTVITFERNPR